LRRIRWTLSALDDLKSISTYIEEQRSLAAANRVCRIIYEAIQSLRQFPHSGKPGLEEGSRELVVSALPSYIVAYRVLDLTLSKFFVSGTVRSYATNEPFLLFLTVRLILGCMPKMRRSAGIKPLFGILRRFPPPRD
jgi:plasmid stabilization system protein ParE